MRMFRQTPPAQRYGVPVEVYDPKNPTKLIGTSFQRSALPDKILSPSISGSIAHPQVRQSPPAQRHGPFVEGFDPNDRSWVAGHRQNDAWPQHSQENFRCSASVSPDEMLLLGHQLWRAFLRGHPSRPSWKLAQLWDSWFKSTPDSESDDDASNSARPPLPVELVRAIIHTAGFVMPDHRQRYRTTQSIMVAVATENVVMAYSASNFDEEPIASRVWFCTPPLRVADIAAVQLVTVSQGSIPLKQMGRVCHTWFEWGVFNGGVTMDEEAGVVGGAFSGNESVWARRRGASSHDQDKGENSTVWHKSHDNSDIMLPGIYEQQRGPEVGIDDQMWDGVQDGAFIAVRACARRNYWENEGQYAEILVWKWFEPVVSVA